jgi:hypothetical protein
MYPNRKVLSSVLLIHPFFLRPSFFLSFRFFFLLLKLSYYLWCGPTVRLESPEKEQLFLSAGYYVSRISDIMQETYALTRLDYLQCRSWTHGCSEFDVTTDVIKLTMRDVGGDELNREQHWGAAIKDSFCTMFVVSLSDYTHLQKKGHTTAKFRHIRKLLWGYLTDEADPKIILILNKQDLFREKLKDVPLHKGCKEFESFAPQAEEESFEAYCKRCEEEITR